MAYLPMDKVIRWRWLANSVPNWEHAKHWGASARANAAQLNPPFNPDMESIVFDALISQDSAEPRLTEVIYGNTRVTDGWLVATENRLIIGIKQAVIGQIPYGLLQAHSLYSEGRHREWHTFTIILTTGDTLIIKAKTYSVSLGQFFIFLGAPPMGKHQMLNQQKEDLRIGEMFVSQFSGFFAEIIDENRFRAW